MDQSLLGDMNTMGGGRDKPGGYTLAIGDTLGQYRIIRPLGRGGMGEVYEAEHAVNRKRIVIKVLPRAATGGTFVDRFRIESRVMSDLRHPQIVEVLHAGEQDGLYYLTMDLVLGPDGEPHSLEDTLASSREARGEAGGKLQPARAEAEVRTLALQICDALAYAHGKGVVHRDLKAALGGVAVGSRRRGKAVLWATALAIFAVASIASIRSQNEAKAGERETNKRHAAASLAREKTQKLDPGQGFGKRLDALEMMWREAEAARQGGGWGQALSGYDAVLAECRTLTESAAAPGDAETRRGEAEEARRAAAGENASADAAALFETGGRASPRAALLAKHGGPKWADVQRQQRIGDASANDPAEGTRAYADALAALPAAAAEALAAEKVETDRLAAEKAAEAERQARQEREARERERQGALTAAIAAARAAKAAGQWQTCLAKAGEALALDAAHTEALALKAEAERNLKPKDPTQGNVLGMAFVEVAPGSFSMGSNDGSSDEKPVRTVPLTKGFWMGKTEVTQAQWRQLMNDSPSYFKGDDLPVEQVDWTRCAEFCRTLTERERAAGRLPAGYVYRLPTEAEWEYAARGGSKSRGFTYSGGNYLGTVGWFTDNSGGTTHLVGKKAANELGLYDMSGNVWEWCQDWYQDSYNGLGSADPSGPATGSFRVYRGGSWFFVASNCRSAFRYWFRPSDTFLDLGFRVVLAPVP
ncbi:MAG: hypothetical protein FJ222_11320 [Lentisphaerae bacterium]|nr:hypothetical protein [Lentisphaerota bacterium]